jgi:pilus assembly protein Flp/PilA
MKIESMNCTADENDRPKEAIMRPALQVPASSKNPGTRALGRKVARFLTSEEGPTAVEYAVMLSLIIAVCLSAITTVGNKASATFSKVASSL